MSHNKKEKKASEEKEQKVENVKEEMPETEIAEEKTSETEPAEEEASETKTAEEEASETETSEAAEEEASEAEVSEAEAVEKEAPKDDSVKEEAPESTEAAEQQTPVEKEEDTVGALLRRTREAKNQDLRDIASFLCIRYQFLLALEESKYKELPGEAYANGFIRSYAAYLGLNPADIITRYKQEFFKAENRENGFYVMSPEEAENVVPTPKIVIISVILLLLAFGIWRSSSETKEMSGRDDAVTAVNQSYSESKTKVSKKTEEDNISNMTVPPVPPAKPEYDTEADGEKSQQSEDAAENTDSEEEEKNKTEEKNEISFREPRIFGQRNYNPRLVLIAKEEVWVEITRGNMVVFSRLLNRGDQYMVSSKNPEELFLKTGNAGGLEVYCDGKLTQALGPRGVMRSNVALIPDDFAAKVVEDIE